MNKIQQLFRHKNKNILSIYFTAGYPELSTTETIICALDNAGADLIEIGIPFSDPVADGLTIQESSNIALKNGMSVALLFDQLKDIRKHTQIPLVLMGYLNPVLQFGFEKFCQQAQLCGIDALIIPDLPLLEYEKSYKKIVHKYGLKCIFLITPQTETSRIRLIDELSECFIYLVTSAAVTGGNTGFTTNHLSYLNRIQSMKLKNPVLAGFGIRNKEDFETVCNYVNGGIIGSSFIRALKNNPGNTESAIQSFIHSIIPALCEQ